MVETFDDGCEVGEHGEVDFAVFLVPVEIKSEVPTAVPIFGDLVVFLEHRHEMVGVLFANVFDAKIVNTEGETDGPSFVGTKTWSELALLVAVFVEAFLKKLLGN